MKRIPIEMVLAVLLLGAVIGIIWSRWTEMETAIAHQNARLAILEADRAKRLQLTACAGTVARIATKCLSMLTLGMVKVH